MKFMQKKYPLLVSTVVSCVIIIISLFILGFFGLKLGVSLGGGSRFEVNMASSETASEYVSKISDVLSEHGLAIDISFVEDKYVVGSSETNSEETTNGDETNSEETTNGDETQNIVYIRKCLVIQIAKKGISEEESSKIQAEVAEALGIDQTYVSSIEEITSSIKAKQVLFIALAFGIIAICFFVFGWLRYDVFAGISFVLSFLHNIILYLSLIILTRIQLTLISLSVALVLTLIMSVILINIYERFREASRLKNAEKISVSERMLTSEKQVIKPYLIILAVAVVIALLLLVIPSNMVRLSSLSILIAIIVTAYTSLIIGPASYTAVLEIRYMNQKAILSRNDTINKAIKKKIKKNSTKKVNNSKEKEL